MIAYTDGACKGNPGPGGFGVVFLNPDKGIETYSKQSEEFTTNNREEMKAILYAACQAKLNNDSLLIFSDSAYAINTFTDWMYSWERNGWLKSNGKEPENLDLIKEFYNLSKGMDIKFRKVIGHSGDQYNELADKLATGKI